MSGRTGPGLVLGQTWMAKNLDVTRFRNGDLIPEVQSQPAWASATTPAWCWYNNDPANNSIYGRMYNVYAITDPRGLAPVGWRLASFQDWVNLTNYYPTISPIRSKTSWNAGGGTDYAGLNILAGGFRLTGYFLNINNNVVYWGDNGIDGIQILATSVGSTGNPGPGGAAYVRVIKNT